MGKKIKINQTLIKAMCEGYCPAQIKAIFIDETVKIKPSESMLRGSYFENLCLGAGNAHGEAPVINLTRLKNGEKSVAHQRIDAQAEVFKKICSERPIIIKHRQIKITLEYNTDYDLEGTLDFTGTIDDNPETAVFDIKLTSSLYKDHTYGPFGSWSWAYPMNQDFIQAYMYHYLFYESTGMKANFYYLVFDYKPNEPEYLIIHKKVDRLHIAELLESVRKTIEKIEFHKSSSWDYEPSYKVCINCPLRFNCPAKILQKPIQQV